MWCLGFILRLNKGQTQHKGYLCPALPALGFCMHSRVRAVLRLIITSIILGLRPKLWKGNPNTHLGEHRPSTQLTVFLVEKIVVVVVVRVNAKLFDRISLK